MKSLIQARQQQQQVSNHSKFGLSVHGLCVFTCWRSNGGELSIVIS